MDPRKQIEERAPNLILTGGRTILILFVIVFAAVGFGMRYFQKAGDENARRLADEGVTSLATITQKTINTSHSSNRQAGGMKHYVLVYSFPLAGSSKEWQGKDEVSESEYDRVEIGDQFDVRYWSQNPDISTILEGSYEAGADLAKTISTISFGIAILLVFVLLIGPVRSALGGKKQE